MSGQNAAVGVEEQHWIAPQPTFDSIVAFAAEDSVALVELNIEGGAPEWHPSKERVGNASLQTEIQGKRGGTWNAKWYNKPNALGTVPDAHNLFRHALGRQNVVVTVNDYTQGALDTLTLNIAGSNLVLTEGTDFNAATSNAVTATNIAADINTNATAVAAGVSATASGAVVTIHIEDDWLEVTSGDATAWSVTRIEFAFRSQNCPDALQLGKYAGPSFMEIASGAWIETLEMEQNGNEEGMWSASGGCARKVYVYGNPRTDATGYGTGVATFTLENTDDAGKLQPGIRIQFRRSTDDVVEDNAGAGYVVNSVDLSTGVVVLASNFAVALTAVNYVIEPFVPSYSISGTITGGIDCGFTIAGTSLGVNSVKYTIQTGIKGLDKEIGANRVNRLTRGKRAPVQGSCEFYFLDENVGQVGHGWNGTTRAVVTRLGSDTSGQRTRVNCAATRLNLPTVDVPEEEEATHEGTLHPRQNAAADDELVIELD